ncbi:MAG: flagellar motor switch protein FliM [Thermodesulfobacteriota bacterium]|nr:flagellar motor switch protein FliM [Thermodesulfobacteriota bacterium]
MSEQILSQEEIDTLLGAMAKGEVDVEVDKKDGSDLVKPYDLTTQSIMLRDQFYALEEVYYKFVKLSRESLSSSLQRPVNVEFVSTEMVKFGELIQGFSDPTGFNMLSMEPLIGTAMLVVEPDLVFYLIDCLFGGEGKPLSQVREFTLIEQRLIRKISTELLKNLEKSLSIVYSIKTSLKKTETKPEFVHLVAQNDLIMVVVFSIGSNEFSGNIHLCIPYLMLEPIKDRLSSAYLRDKDIENTWSSQIRTLLDNARINIVAELGRTTSTVSDLLNLEINDVCRLNTGPYDVATINIEGIPKYHGIPGIVKGNRAVEIVKLIRQDGGNNKYGYN